MGFVIPSAVHDPVDLTPLYGYHSIMNDNHLNFMKESFHFRVNPGFSMSCAPCQKKSLTGGIY